MADLEKLLADGLLAGYAGKSTFEHVHRGPFEGEQSLLTPKGGVYIDQWFASLRGGGQELAQNEDGKATRLYAGGTISPGDLAKLGITEEQVSGQLKKAIKELGQKTRLREDCIPEADGDWQYSYRILDSVDQIDLTIGMEQIRFRGEVVFAHGFLLSPVK